MRGCAGDIEIIYTTGGTCATNEAKVLKSGSTTTKKVEIEERTNYLSEMCVQLDLLDLVTVFSPFQFVPSPCKISHEDIGCYRTGRRCIH